MNSFIELLSGAGGVVLMALIQLIVIFAGFAGVKLLKKLSKKVELEIDDACWTSIEKIVNTIVKSTNQRIVDEMKEHNIDGKLIGIRERTLIKENEQTGKYKPAILNNQMYNHPLGFNLYNLNNSKDNIQKMRLPV